MGGKVQLQESVLKNVLSGLSAAYKPDQEMEQFLLVSQDKMGESLRSTPAIQLQKLLVRQLRHVLG